ncbi:phospho-N-acetylmuramoyl-pentapeptide-transferase [Candidatus Acetothermia bacterium]|jgi:phospho-N-acetylmuramoyl-pentapeptide-transferase|nr:phospho-N-acetylmuramoyl-pentapeptide-transferase [Candidatus Acetothermia bacterium]MCI2427697.1 phospho-N-acetylmuramoyl-pentapeptide-transferase [Candidatus Acetothermia bacterium]MCI2428323.1 phospho-N-acetylmuramoyl-pentapeptide-transferase [Candidatus Acetothermia bacterium]
MVVTSLFIAIITGLLTLFTARRFAVSMRRAAIGQHIRDYGPDIHTDKAGTPTMGGVVILIVWSLAMLIIHLLFTLTWEGIFIWITGIAYGAIGLLDDLLSLKRGKALGLLARYKILLQTVIAGILFLVFFEHLSAIPLAIPFSTNYISLPAVLLFCLVWSLCLATTNGMNLTDGLDGLAAGTTVIILLVYQFLFAHSAIQMTVIPLVGILLGFLWLNFYPSKLFLGNVGSFALGGIVSGLALTTGTALILPLIAGLLVIETLSVIIQVSYYKCTKKRIFKISPFHHHFERAKGIDYPYLLRSYEWPEPTITIRFWLIEGCSAMIGIIAVLV